MITSKKIGSLLCGAAIMMLSGCTLFGTGTKNTEPVGTPSVTQADSVTESQFVIVDVSELRNASATGGDKAFDAHGNAYPADKLPSGKTTVKEVDVVFDLPDFTKVESNVVTAAGQAVPVSAGKYNTLYVLAAATNEDQNAKLTLMYGDEKAEAAFNITDWCKAPAFGEKQVASYERVKGGDYEEATCRIFLQEVKLDPTKKLTGIVLPENKDVHIFAMTLGK